MMTPNKHKILSNINDDTSLIYVVVEETLNNQQYKKLDIHPNIKGSKNK